MARAILMLILISLIVSEGWSRPYNEDRVQDIFRHYHGIGRRLPIIGYHDSRSFLPPIQPRAIVRVNQKPDRIVPLEELADGGMSPNSVRATFNAEEAERVLKKVLLSIYDQQEQ